MNTDGNTDAINRHLAEREAYDEQQDLEAELQDLRDEVDTLTARLAEVEEMKRLLEMGYKINLRAELADVHGMLADPRVKADAYAKGLADALGIIASLEYGANEDVDRGHEESYRAIEEHISKWQKALALEAMEKTDD